MRVPVTVCPIGNWSLRGTGKGYNRDGKLGESCVTRLLGVNLQTAADCRWNWFQTGRLCLSTLSPFV